MLGYLKRRFSSGDLQGEAADQRDQEPLPSFLNPFNSSSQQPQSAGSATRSQQRQHPGLSARPTSTEPVAHNMAGGGGAPGASAKPRAAYPSAPTSPTRSTSFSANPVVESITGQISSTLSRGIFGSSSTTGSGANKTSGQSRGKTKVVLVVGEPHTDWSKYFRGRKVFGDWDVRVEQAQFGELSLIGNSDTGCTIDVQTDKTGTKSMRSFKPDLVVIRQSSHDAGEDWRNLVMGILYSGLPALNSLHAVYNMHERVWMFAHLELVRNRLGRDIFPLIEQTYYPSHKEMAVPTRFPMVIKIGNCRNGRGKIKVDNHFDFQDMASIVAVSGAYATSEPFVDAKCDLLIQKIGTHFKAFQRKSLSGSWKTNTGSAILEQVPMNDRFRLWITEVSKLFGGLDMCCLKVLQSKSDEFFIYELKGSNMNLLGETQEEDRKMIAELVMTKIQMFCRPNLPKAESLQSMNRQSDVVVVPPAAQGPPPMMSSGGGSGGSHHQMASMNHHAVPMSAADAASGPRSSMQHNKQPPQAAPAASHAGVAAASQSSSCIPAGNSPHMTTGPGNHPSAAAAAVVTASINSISNNNLHGSATTHHPPGGAGAAAIGYNSLPRHDAAAQQQRPGMDHSSVTGGPRSGSMPPAAASASTSSLPGRPNIPPRQTSLKSNSGVAEDSDDTMKNLRKTFAGIFGDM